MKTVRHPERYGGGQARRAAMRLVVGVQAAAAILGMPCAAWASAAGVTLPAGTGARVWPKDRATALEGLRATAASERLEACLAVRRMPPRVAGKAVLEALNDDELPVRLCAARVAYEWRLEGAGPVAVSWLTAPELDSRLQACQLLEVVDADGAVAGLGRALSDVNPRVRTAAARALGKLRLVVDPGRRDEWATRRGEAVGHLLGRLDDGDGLMRAEVVRALGRLGDGRAVVPLLGRLQDNEVSVRAEAAWALGRFGVAGEPSAPGRGEAKAEHQAAASVKDAAASGLILALRDSSATVQAQALRSLGRLRASQAVPVIQSMLATPRLDASVRTACVVALGQIGTAAAGQAIVHGLAAGDMEMTDPVLRAALAPYHALVRPLARESLAFAGPSQARYWALLLGDLGQEQDVDVLVRAMNAGQIGVPVGLQALGKLGSMRGLAYVLEGLEHDQLSTRGQAQRAVLALLVRAQGDSRAVMPLIQALGNAAMGTAEHVALVRLLGYTRSGEALATLGEVAQALQPSMRRVAVEAVSLIGEPSGGAEDYRGPRLTGEQRETRGELLLKALDDEAAPVRFAAAQGLWRAGSVVAARQLLDWLEAGRAVDEGAMAMAVSGAIAGVGTGEAGESIVQRVVRLLPTVTLAVRDGLWEGLGRLSYPSAREGVRMAATAADPADRAKAAEVSTDAALVRGLLADRDARVRANAVWRMGMMAEAGDAARVQGLCGDANDAVAGNAVAAYGKMIHRGVVDRARGAAHLCSLLGASAETVKINVLVSLRTLGLRCGAGAAERALVLEDASWQVRQAAAMLVGAAVSGDASRVTSDAAWLDSEVLERCALDEPVATVAKHCRQGKAQAQLGRSSLVQVPTLMYAMGDGMRGRGRDKPSPGAAYSLAFAEGLVRSGWTDRRGAAFEQGATAGPMRLQGQGR